MKRLVVGALLVDDVAAPSRVLAARRTTPPAGRWEFPGGKVEPGESAPAALEREIREELLVDVVVHRRLDAPSGGRWPINEALEMELWWCTTAGEATPHDSHDAVRWLTAAQVYDVEWLPSDLAAIPVLAGQLSG
ncbi:NUDIX domain-containing protein [Tessaracoccus rhinocerotis]|uniref:8-oxo-dGTP diphosphatase n=1 Tax=Tessaracoccus rhinocerotis TaxID=1689449 RepID=A0A553K010_9ACTN|nr:NUDIX domain-containing protein [Tessaracoccus rhinocerotis]TRY18041.1 NUDIX domain-containing protein [Tessaracoccus rhinocerotis]